MSKLLSYLTACLLLLTIVHGESASCAAHPAYLIAKTFYERVSNRTKGGRYHAPKFLDSYIAATPSIKNAEDLGVCSQYAGQTSCCSKDMVTFMDRVSTASVTTLFNGYELGQKFAELIHRIISRHSCSTSISLVQSYEFFSNTAFTKIKQIDEGLDLCRVQFAKAISRINRGAMCAMCMGFEKVTDFIKQGKVVIQSSTQDAFMADIHAAFSCVTAISENQTLVEEAIGQIVDHYTLGQSCDSATITTIKSKISEIFLSNKSNGRDGEGNDLCTAQVLFNRRDACEDSIYGNNKLVDLGQNYSPENPARLLQLIDVVDTDISASTGIDSYIESENDNLINVKGDYYKTFNMIYPNNTSNATASTFNSVQTTFEIRLLSLTSLLGLMMLLSF